MYSGYLALTVLLIMVNLGGLTAGAARALAHFSKSPMTDLPMASLRLLAVLLVVLGFFFFEHFHGLGKLSALWPLSTTLAALSLWNFYRTQPASVLSAFKRSEAVFWLGCAYGLLWRIAFPDINGNSEHLPDLYFVSTYMGGHTLPAPDLWLAGSRFDYYYGFQHYAAALMGRSLHLEAGLAMNLSFALLIGFITSLVWDITGSLLPGKRLRLLVLLTVLLGGNGLAPLMPFMIRAEQTDSMMPDRADTPLAQDTARIWEVTRFSGMFENRVNTDFGRLIADPTDPPLDLPLETIGYFSYLGDYHPPLGGFVLLLWSLALTLSLFRASGSSSHWKNFALGLTPALTFITNVWTFPLQLLLLGSWGVYRHLTLMPAQLQREQRALGAGLLCGFAAIFPFLAYFTAGSTAVPVKFVTAALHSPWPFFVALHWPILLLIGFGLVLARHNRWAGWLALLLGVCLILSEVIYFDDPLSGTTERFNTTLKWWSWIWPAAIAGLGSAALASTNIKLRFATIATMLALLSFALPLLGYAWHAPKPGFGQLAGNSWLLRDEAVRGMVTYLKNAPEGVVMESVQKGMYSADTAITLNSGKPLLLGWPDHVGLYRGWPNDVRTLSGDIKTFYQSDARNPLPWLRAHNIRYIVWSRSDEERDPLARRQITAMIEAEFTWLPFWQLNDSEIGLWVRR